MTYARLARAGVKAGFRTVDTYYDYLTRKYAYDYQKGLYRDIDRFYADYYKNTGHKPRYPYKQGAVYDLSRLYSAKRRYVSYFGDKI